MIWNERGARDGLPVPGSVPWIGERPTHDRGERAAMSRISAFMMTRPRMFSAVACTMARPRSSPETYRLRNGLRTRKSGRRVRYTRGAFSDDSASMAAGRQQTAARSSPARPREARRRSAHSFLGLYAQHRGDLRELRHRRPTPWVNQRTGKSRHRSSTTRARPREAFPQARASTASDAIRLETPNAPWRSRRHTQRSTGRLR